MVACSNFVLFIFRFEIEMPFSIILSYLRYFTGLLSRSLCKLIFWSPSILDILLEQSIGQGVYSRVQNYCKNSYSVNIAIEFISYEFCGTTGKKCTINKKNGYDNVYHNQYWMLAAFVERNTYVRFIIYLAMNDSCTWRTSHFHSPSHHFLILQGVWKQKANSRL